MGYQRISVLLADDNLIVREGVGALLAAEPDIEVVGVAADRDELIAQARQSEPQVVVTDIRMPPNFQQEGIDAAKEVRKRHPGTGVVVLSQHDDPEYAIALLGDGAAGYAFLLKDRVADGDQLARAVREVATGGSMLDPRIVEVLVGPAVEGGELTSVEEKLLRMVAEGRPIKAIATLEDTTPAAVADEVERLFLKLAKGASSGVDTSVRRLQMLHRAIVERKEQGEKLSRLLPGGVAEKLLQDGWQLGQSEKLDVTVLISDIRGYSTIAEHADPSALAAQLNTHRAKMNDTILSDGGTVMLFMGDAVMAVFGAPIPQPDHAQRATKAALAMQAAQASVNRRWAAEGRAAFELGIGLSSGEVAAVLLGSEERLEYTVIGDTVNLAQRLQQWAAPGELVMSEATYRALDDPLFEAEPIEPARVKGREAPVRAYRIPASGGGP